MLSPTLRRAPRVFRAFVDGSGSVVAMDFAMAGLKARLRRLSALLWIGFRVRHGFRALCEGGPDRRGSVAMTMALSLFPILLVSGGAMDYGIMTAKRDLSQEALDSAVLATANTGSLNSTLATNIYKSYLLNSNMTLTSIAFATSVDGGGNTFYKGDAYVTLKTSFMGIAGMQTWNIHTHSEAYPKPQSVISVTVKPTRAQGAWSKDVFIWTKDAQGNILTQNTVMTYRYNGSTATTTPSVGSWSTTFSVSSYATYGIGLLIYQDMNYKGALVSPTTKYSDSATASTWIKTSGVCQNSGGQTVNMEDGGNSDFQDFGYVMTCTLGTAVNAMSYLVK